MKRFLSVWLPRWPIERHRWWHTSPQSKQGLPPDRNAPFVLAEPSQNGLRITATNPAADRNGLRIAMPLADARAMCPRLLVGNADHERDRTALRRLALWCRRYSPLTRPHDPDGLAIDIAGCAHLFGGEAALLDELDTHLRAFGLTARSALAPTIGAAWAAARYAPDNPAIITAETLHGWLAPLPTAALRLEENTTRELAKVGLRQIRDLLDKPRAPLVARFGPQLVERLDQALGKQDESFGAGIPPPSYRAVRHFAEPLVTMTAIEYAVDELTRDLAGRLKSAGKGARNLELGLFRVDGWFETARIQTSVLSRDASHMARLFRERLDTIKDNTGFGFETVTLDALDVETIVPYQDSLRPAEKQDTKSGDLSRLLDRLSNRFGAERVTRLTPRESYIPERASRSVPVFDGLSSHDWTAHEKNTHGPVRPGRPILLFDPPEPITAFSEGPDGPPVRFKWHRVFRWVTRADGPERITPEWWRHQDGESRQTRDYYRVEDEIGQRFWLYRNRLHERKNDKPRWFLHGLFA